MVGPDGAVWGAKKKGTGEGRVHGVGWRGEKVRGTRKEQGVRSRLRPRKQGIGSRRIGTRNCFASISLSGESDPTIYSEIHVRLRVP